MRKEEFANNEYYHIYNRGVDKRKIFTGARDYSRFIKNLEEFNTTDPNWKKTAAEFQGLALNKKPLVEIIAYCLNPNHYHLILKQVKEKGITEFMQRIGTGYTMYFNKKSKRTGSLFQGTFKTVHIDSNEYLLYLSAYINHNYFIHGYSKDKNEIYQYSSLPDFLKTRKQKWLNPKIVTKQFKNPQDYHKFSKTNALYMKENKEKYTLEE
jgi:putative transposase